jgi:anti-anti-sigma factor
MRTSGDGDVRIRWCVSGDVLTVNVGGELDLGARSHWDAVVTPLLDPPLPERVDVDLRGVSFMDSSGLGLLLTLRQWAIDNATALRLLDVPACVRRVLDYSGVTDLFHLSTATAASASAAASSTPTISATKLEPD